MTTRSRTVWRKLAISFLSSGKSPLVVGRWPKLSRTRNWANDERPTTDFPYTNAGPFPDRRQISEKLLNVYSPDDSTRVRRASLSITKLQNHPITKSSSFSRSNFSRRSAHHFCGIEHRVRA